MNIDISTVIMRDNKIKTVVKGSKKGPLTTSEEIMEESLIVAEMMTDGYATTKSIMEKLGVSRPTAIKRRNQALMIIAEEQKPMNRTHLRNLEIGRIQKLMASIITKLNTTDYDEVATTEKGTVQLIGHTKWNDLMKRLKEQAELLHRITGMNTEINVNVEEKRRIVFVRNNTDTKPENDDVIDLTDDHT